MGGNVIVVTSVEEFDAKVSAAANDQKAVVIDFFATWCGPCRMISPYFETLSKEYESVVFIKLDVDQVSAIAERFGVSAMPTFAVVKNGEKVDELVGASKDRLKALIEKYSA